MSDLFGHDGRDIEQPAHGRPAFLIGKNGLATAALEQSDASFVLDRLKERIRRLTWLDDFGPESAHEIWRAARMCHELATQFEEQRKKEQPVLDPEDLLPLVVFRLSNLSLEDLDILYDFPKHWSTDALRKLIDQERGRVRSAGPVGPVEADAMAKDLVDVMNC